MGWSLLLIVISSLTTVGCIGITIGMIWESGGLPLWLAVLPLGVVCGAALFTIRGYAITSDAIVVH